MGRARKSDLKDFVIGGFTKEEKELLAGAVERAVLSAECIVEKGIDKAMNEYNIKQKSAEKKDADKKGTD